MSNLTTTQIAIFSALYIISAFFGLYTAEKETMYDKNKFRFTMYVLLSITPISNFGFAVHSAYREIFKPANRFNKAT